MSVSNGGQESAWPSSIWCIRLKEYPPVQKGGSFNLDAVLNKAGKAHSGAQQ